MKQILYLFIITLVSCNVKVAKQDQTSDTLIKIVKDSTILICNNLDTIEFKTTKYFVDSMVPQLNDIFQKYHETDSIVFEKMIDITGDNILDNVFNRIKWTDKECVLINQIYSLHKIIWSDTILMDEFATAFFYGDSILGKALEPYSNISLVLDKEILFFYSDYHYRPYDCTMVRNYLGKDLEDTTYWFKTLESYKGKCVSKVPTYSWGNSFIWNDEKKKFSLLYSE